MANLGIVLRFNNSGIARFANDPIDEHIKLIKRHKSVSFAKVGKPLSDITVSQLEFQIRSNIPTSLYLLTKSKKQSNYDCHRCNVISVANSKNPSSDAPEYYQHIKNDIGTWFVLTSIERCDNGVLDDLRLSSSGKSVTQALKSMSAMFVVDDINDKN